jgi:hypothetical protein
MSRAVRARWAVVLALSSACASSSDGSGTDADAGATTDAGAPPSDAAADAGMPDAAQPDAASGFGAIYEDIFLARNCDSYLCHGANAGGLDLTSRAAAYADLVDAESTGLDCRDLGLSRVVPGDPDASLLLLKLDAEPPCGDSMPPSTRDLLPDAEVDRIRAWVAAGALP